MSAMTIFRATLAIILGLAIVACSPEPKSFRFGVLGGLCDPARLHAERAAGIEVVVLDLAWQRYEPARGEIDLDYVASVRAQLSACREAGMSVVISPGLQYPPAWVRSLPSATQLDQDGSLPDSGTVDLVFSAPVREAVRAYFRRIATSIQLDEVVAIRIGTSATGELGYPGPYEGTDAGGSYWAFNRPAQSGAGLAAGIGPTPMPGWRPGTAYWNGSVVTDKQVESWFAWYSQALVVAVSWQAESLRHVGFRGEFHVPVAGRGVLPADLQRAVSGRLDGRNNPDRALERGLFYPQQFATIAELDRRLRAASSESGVKLDFTGLDDDTAVRARRADPPQDMCRDGDVEVVASGGSGAEAWSGLRWTIAVARRAGLRVIGENPGPPDAPFTGGSDDSDSLAAQLAHGISYARACGLDTFLFAFEDDLFDEESGVTVDDYARKIAAVRDGGSTEGSRKESG